jgi:hypothetical protein
MQKWRLWATVYRLNTGASETELRQTEHRLFLELPAPARAFWMSINGLIVEDPPFEVLPLSQFSVDGGLLAFARCSHNVRIAFDTRTENEAGQCDGGSQKRGQNGAEVVPIQY